MKLTVIALVLLLATVAVAQSPTRSFEDICVYDISSWTTVLNEHNTGFVLADSFDTVTGHCMVFYTDDSAPYRALSFGTSNGFIGLDNILNHCAADSLCSVWDSWTPIAAGVNRVHYVAFGERNP